MVITTNNLYKSSVDMQPAFFVRCSDGLEHSANITLLVHRLIEVIIMDFGSGNATFISPQYENVVGKVNGTMTFRNNGAMNGAQGLWGIVRLRAQTVTSLPSQDEPLSHTSVPSLGLNITMAAESIEVVFFTTGGHGYFVWLCESLCGSGASGLQGEMPAPGWLDGILTVG